MGGAATRSRSGRRIVSPVLASQTTQRRSGIACAFTAWQVRSSSSLPLLGRVTTTHGHSEWPRARSSARLSSERPLGWLWKSATIARRSTAAMWRMLASSCSAIANDPSSAATFLAVSTFSTRRPSGPHRAEQEPTALARISGRVRRGKLRSGRRSHDQALDRHGSFELP